MQLRQCGVNTRSVDRPVDLSKAHLYGPIYKQVLIVDERETDLESRKDQEQVWPVPPPQGEKGLEPCLTPYDSRGFECKYESLSSKTSERAY